MSLATGFVPPCIPTRAPKPPAGADWVHEIKHDGYRLQVRRVGDQVRLFTRRGYDWSGRYPAIAVTSMLLRARSFRSMARRWCAVRMASPSSTPSTVVAPSARPSLALPHFQCGGERLHPVKRCAVDAERAGEFDHGLAGIHALQSFPTLVSR
jgi:hypothetical protein